VEKLENFCDQILKCRVVVESPHRHSHDGRLYNVNIDLKIPGTEIVVKREPNEDLYVAVRDSFNAAKRRLEEYLEHLRRESNIMKRRLRERLPRCFPTKATALSPSLTEARSFFIRTAS